MKNLIFIIVTLFLLSACSSDSTDNENQIITLNPTDVEIYFPPVSSNNWETVSIEDLEWNEEEEEPLRGFLDEKDTKAFIILKDGKIAVEWYFDDHTQDSNWYWASAGKTLTAFTVGLAQDDGFLNITDKTSEYLGEGWTSLEKQKEDLITVRNQLTMTSGLDDAQGDCKDPACLNYLADAGSRWAYHNAPYTLLQSVVAEATSTEWSTYFNEKLRDRIGMDGFWFSTNNLNNVYFSTARSMARFGLLNLNNGVWQDESIITDTDYVTAMSTTSQNLNESYGYLWWLNGKNSYRLPQTQAEFNGPMVPNAPSDLYSGLGKNDQKIYIVPSEGLVIIRMGDDAGEGLLAASSFDNQLWTYLDNYIN